MTSKVKKELTAAFEQFKKNALPTEPGKRLAEAKKKVGKEAKRKSQGKEERLP